MIRPASRFTPTIKVFSRSVFTPTRPIRTSSTTRSRRSLIAGPSIWLSALPEDLERFLKLRTHWNVEAFAVRQPGFEPFCIDRIDVARDHEIADCTLDAFMQVGLVAAERNSVRVVGEEFTYHLEPALGAMLGNQAVQQDVVSGEGVGVAVCQHAVGLLMIGTFEKRNAELEFLVERRQRLRVGRAPRHDHLAALQVAKVAPDGPDRNHDLGAADKDHGREIDELAALQIVSGGAAFKIDRIIDERLQPGFRRG